MRRHPQWGYDLLVEGQVDCAVTLDVCLHHHEKIDGSGYHRRLRGALTCRRQRKSQRLDHEHHARTAAVRSIIDRTVTILGEISGIPAIQLVESALLRPAGDAETRQRREHLGKQRNDIVGLASRPGRYQSASHSTVMLPVAISTAVT